MSQLVNYVSYVKYTTDFILNQCICYTSTYANKNNKSCNNINKRFSHKCI